VFESLLAGARIAATDLSPPWSESCRHCAKVVFDRSDQKQVAAST
jgi:hypothetical protein